MLRSINPATGKLNDQYPVHDQVQVETRLNVAQTAFNAWRDRSFSQRAELLLGVAGRLQEGRDRFARLISEEMGKPIKESEAEIVKCAWLCEYYARESQAMLAVREISTEASASLVRYEPIGGVLGVMPWNFPFWQVLRFCVPALMAGNVALLKHAPNVPGCAIALQELFDQVGFPPGAFTSLLVEESSVEQILDHPAVQGVALTGSVAAGAAVAAQAGARIKKSVLELGGSDPFIVLADADPIGAAESAVAGRMLNSGQSCIAAKRFIVEEPIAEVFLEAFKERLARLQVGDPMDPETQLGPLAREDLRQSLHRQVCQSVEGGATLELGGEPLGGVGFFYPPTLLFGVGPGMPAFDEETFGPLAAVCVAADEQEAIALANHTEYGLGASIWTQTPGRGRELAEQIEAGCVFINSVVRSDPRLPFGGIKRSGYGRELGPEGIYEFVNIKTVWVN